MRGGRRKVHSIGVRPELDPPCRNGSPWTARERISRFCPQPCVLAAGISPAHTAGISHPSTAPLSPSQLVPGEQEGKPLASLDSQQGRGRLGPGHSR